MAEEPEEKDKGAAEEAAPSKKGLSKLVLIVAPVVLLVAGVGAAWYLGFLPIGGKGEKGHGETAEASAEHEAGKDKEHGAGALLPLEPFIANLADEDGARYLKTTFQVEFADKEPPHGIEARMPQVRDLLLTLLTSKTFHQIRTPEGKQELREEIINRFNQALDHDAVKAVYFTEFIVQ